jgi:hypothetical protein
MMVATRPKIIATGPQSHGTGARSLQLAGREDAVDQVV